jgi:DNA repair protein RecN (Recombination protein N)
MLTELRIRDFAIIDELELTFNPGFVVLTGETGAGKSIIIDAVEMLLGGRADTALIRAGTEVAFVEGTFQLEPNIQSIVLPILEREDLQDDPEVIHLSREIRREGRNICRVNGRVVTLALLSEVGQWLIDVHGQSEHLSLLRVREHLTLLDRYADVDQLKSTFFKLHSRLSSVRKELSELQQKEANAARQIEFLTYQINEIDSAALQPDEEESLQEERTRLANAERLAQLSEQALGSLDNDIDTQASALDLIGRSYQLLEQLKGIDDTLQGTVERSQLVQDGLVELVRELRRYRDSIEFNPKRLDFVEERLGLIQDLKRKYGDTIEAILTSAQEAQAELDQISHAEERVEALVVQESELLPRLGETGALLSEKRREAAENLGLSIEQELGDLKMAGAQFGFNLSWRDDPEGAPVDDRHLAFTERGFDQLEFLVAPNPGEGLKSLAKIASGGETSRLMLGLKGVLAQADQTPTLIFDEIDQGIGGRVGAIVGEKLWRLATSHQVLCITHLPQLAAYGDQHIKVEKLVDGGRTLTRTRSLDAQERIPEMAIMLGDISEANLESATDLLHTGALLSVRRNTKPSSSK